MGGMQDTATPLAFNGRGMGQKEGARRPYPLWLIAGSSGLPSATPTYFGRATKDTRRREQSGCGNTGAIGTQRTACANVDQGLSPWAPYVAAQD
jgi:hypothetical protein